ncbi:MAG: D-glycero-alpha-D-manno-heptose-1,7-bisphosphate 7-phosphatase [Actinomycetota bacterium]
MRAAVFLDRDGVLNAVRIEGGIAGPPRDLDELQIPEDAHACLERLKKAGYVLLVVSNQPDVARGDVDPAAVSRINARLRERLPIDAVYVCVHDNADGCACRKPRPGMIHSAARDWQVDLGRSWLIGDRWTDIAAADAAGVDGILIESAHSWRPTSIGGPPPGLRPRFTGSSLRDCIDFIFEAPDCGSPRAPALGGSPRP